MRTGIDGLLTKESLEAKLASFAELNSTKIREILFDVVYTGCAMSKAWEMPDGTPAGKTMGHATAWKKFVEENRLVTRSGKAANTIDTLAKLCHPALDSWVNEFDSVEQSFHQKQLGQNMLQNCWPFVWNTAEEKVKVGSKVDKTKRNEYAKECFDILHLIASENGGAVSDEKLAEFSTAWEKAIGMSIDVDELKSATNKFKFLRLSMSDENKAKTDAKQEVLGRLKKLTALETGVDANKVKIGDVQKVFTEIEVDAGKYRNIAKDLGADEKTTVEDEDVISAMKSDASKYHAIKEQLGADDKDVQNMINNLKSNAQPGREGELKTASTIYTLSQLRKIVDSASLDDELFVLLSHSQCREMIRQAIIKCYFPDKLEHNPLVDIIPDIIDGGDVNHHLDKFEQQLSMTQDRYSLIQRSLLSLEENVGNEPPKRKYSFVKGFERNDRLSKYLKELYDWKCQICGFTIEKKGGGLYAETHHLEALSKGGPDSIENIIVVCPNHHALFEYGDVSILSATSEKVEVLINNEHHTIKRIPLR